MVSGHTPSINPKLDGAEGSWVRFGKTNPIVIDENGGGFGVRMRTRQSAKKHK
jgi:hypothetical protein